MSEWDISRRGVLAGGSGLAALSLAGATPSAQAAQLDDELAWTPAWRIKEMFKARRLSPLEYARFILERTERNHHLGAFITVFPENLLEAARQATERPGEGLLAGLPISVKDTVYTKGLRTTLGSALFKDHVPDKDSVASEQVKKHGGIIFAKSNTPEFALNRRSFNLVSREAVNPWDTSRTSGGSSGGAGVATAAGLGPLAVGTDGGGSIRLPSAFNGVFGLAPSRGRVPNGAGDFGAPSSVIGPMARDVRDAALLLQAIAVVDARDPFTMRTPAPDYLAELDRGVRGVRMAWSADLGRVIPDEPEIVPICHEAAKAFKAMGAVYTEPSIRIEDPQDPMEPDPEYSRAQVNARVRAINPDFIDPISWSRKLPPQDYEKLSIYIRDRSDRPTQLEYAMSILPEVRYRTKDRLSDLFQRIDLLLCPTIARRAFVIARENATPFQYTAYCHIVNVAGYCAASVPAGFYKGMPVGLQIIGRPGDEALVLRAARAFERERPWAHHRPQVL
jgi:Asp-tRNA(Asn)/Glu-tRNA(Gln) amidotransferase A subunit family amidase